MPLDNAQFIAELSVTDPPGTDPLNQGDDHIRTTKLAVQQSFPNVGSAVPQTGAQMAQMAIKNEVNTFTLANHFNVRPTGTTPSGTESFAYLGTGVAGQGQGQTFSQTNFFTGVANFGTTVNFATPIFLPDGSAAIPATRFTNFNGTGMFGATNLIGFAVNGVRVFQASATSFFSDLQIRAPDGSAAAPSFTFGLQTNTGIYRPGSSLGITVTGIDSAFFLTNQMRMVPDGTASVPAYGFQGESSMGMFRLGTNALAFSIASVSRFEVRPTDIRSNQVHLHASGSAASPGVAFLNESNTGMYLHSPANVSLATLGVQRVTISSAEFNTTVPNRAASGSVSAPAYSFSSDIDTGMYRSAGDRINWATAGVRRAFVDVSQFQMNVKLNAIDGTEAAPAYSFQNFLGTGFFAAANAVTATVNGGTVWAMSTNGMFVGAGFQINADGPLLQNAPGFCFSNDPDTGIYRHAVNTVGIAGSGQTIATFEITGWGVVAGVETFLSLPTSPGTPTSLWNNGGVVNVA